jgi:hypothetical membrane protein
MDSKDKPSRFIPAAALAGILGFCLVIVGFSALGLMKPGFDPVRSTISELGESGGANAGIASALFILIGLLEILLAAGLYLRNRPSRAVFIGACLLAVNGLFDYAGSGLFPCDAGGRYDSLSGQVHFLVSVIGMSVMVFPAFFFAFAFRRQGRKGQGAIALAAGFAILAGAALFNVAFFGEAPWLGGAQRVLDFGYWLWLFFLACDLSRKKGT